MANSQSRIADPEPSKVYVQLGMDYGTSSTKIAYQCRFDENADYGDSKMLVFPDGNPTLPACVAWSEKAFYFGTDLKDRVSRGKVPAAKVIDCAKVAIHYETSEDEDVTRPEFVKQVFEKLEAAKKSLQELLNEHMQGLISIAEKRIQEDEEVQQRFGKQGKPKIDIKLRLSVPQIWTTDANDMMIRAAGSAGITATELVNEPQCALAASLALLEYPKQRNSLLELGDNSYVMVDDLGCGTADAVLYRLKGAMTTNMKNIMEVVAQAPGTTHSSHRINDAIYQYIEERVDISKTVKRLAMSEDEFKYHLLTAIERAKLVVPLDSWSNLTITNKDGKAWNPPGEAMVTKATMEKEYNRVIDGIIKMGDNLLNERNIKPKSSSSTGQVKSNQLSAVILLGGFSNSKYVQDRFHEKYRLTEPIVFWPGSMGVAAVINECRVAYGSLCERYAKILVRELPRKYTYAFLQDEEYSPKYHPDCRRPGPASKPGSLGALDFDKIRRNADGTKFAPARLIKVLSSTDTLVEGVPLTTREKTEYRVLTKAPALRKWFVRVDEGISFENHDCALQAPEPKIPADPVDQWNFKKGFHPWKTITATFNKQQKKHLKGLKKYEVGDEEYCKIWTHATVKYTGKEMEIGWDILDDEDNVVFSMVGEQQVWNGERSEFPRDDAEIPGSNEIA